MTLEHLTDDTDETIYQCRHIFTDGRRCGSPVLRGAEGSENFCYYHHNSRRPIQNARTRKRRQSCFTVPNPEDRSAIQLAIGEVLRRIASNEIDPRRAGLLLYGLQIASRNLPKVDPKAKLKEPVSEITHDPEHGILAPPAELGHDEPKSSAQRFLEELDEMDDAEFERNRQREAEIRQAGLLDLQASEEPSADDTKSTPNSTHLKTLRKKVRGRGTPAGVHYSRQCPEKSLRRRRARASASRCSPSTSTSHRRPSPSSSTTPRTAPSLRPPASASAPPRASSATAPISSHALCAAPTPAPSASCFP